MDIQRLRNITTGFLHTTMDDIYEDVEFLTGEKGVMTHMLPNAAEALQPWLKEKLTDPRFWNKKFDQSHVGEVDIAPMNDVEKAEFWKRYSKLPSIFR